MSRVVEVPGTLDESAFETLIGLVRSGGNPDARLLLDARSVRWVSPYGLIGLLAVGHEARLRTGLPPLIEPPQDAEVRSYINRMHFWPAAAEVFDLKTLPSRPPSITDALIEVTTIRSHEDVHAVVEGVRERAQRILHTRLGYPKPAVIHFSVMLSEVCQNILEHARSIGWVCAQRYRWQRRLGRDVIVLAVMDVGVGFEGSLGAEHARRYGESWSAASALEAAFLRGESRFPEPGRGQGLQAIRRQVIKWNGAIRIRSGDAVIARVPEWDDAEPLRTGLPRFPGAQVLIVLPERAGREGA
ncbi:hypothetical protein [Candidatus Palauibacter sp.]|uniref:hypothetical protein n=1 Tax=Candidatus Palauibacter sp. TaxID=3101350 RepID=UPI003AF21427